MNVVYATRATIPHPSACSWNIMQTCEALADMGHDVTLLAARKFWRERATPEKSIDYYGVTAGFTLRRVVDVPRSEWLFNRFVVRFARQQRAVLYTRSTSLAERAARQCVHVVLELHHLPTRFQLREVQRAFSTGFLRRLVAITHSLASDLSAALPHELTEAVLIVAADAVNPMRFHPMNIPSPTDRDFSCGYVGGFSQGKGIEVIVPLARSMPESAFHCFGGTFTQLQSLNQSQQTPNNLTCHGRLRPSDVPQALHQFDIALLPNQPSVVLKNGVDIGRYTSPMKMFEYMASGKVIVASDLPVIREILIDGVNAILVPHNDIRAWKSAIENVRANADLSTRLSLKASQDARELYSYQSRMRRVFAGFTRCKSQFPRTQKQIANNGTCRAGV